VLRFDFRGRGESRGDYLKTDLDAMIDDAAAAAAFLRRETGVRELAAVGLCSGANVALAAAAWARAYDRAACLSVLPFQSHKSAMQNVRRTRGMLRSLLGKAVRPATWWRLVTGRVRVLRALGSLFGGEGGSVHTSSGQTRNLKDSSRDLVGALLEYRGRLLFVWGGADAEGMGARAHYEELARRGRLEVEYRVVEGANHNYYSLEWERDALEATLSFVTRA
jgi:pimeloyl-ACP methyl ester carboxylesterase